MDERLSPGVHKVVKLLSGADPCDLFWMHSHYRVSLPLGLSRRVRFPKVGEPKYFPIVFRLDDDMNGCITAKDLRETRERRKSHSPNLRDGERRSLL